MKPLFVTSTSIALAVSLSACQPHSTIKPGVPDACGTVNSIIADFDTGFADYRGSSTSYNVITLYKARTELVKGHCEVWSWSGGQHAYVCSAGAPNLDIANARHKTSQQLLKNCLSQGWQSTTSEKERDGERIGVATRYTSPQYPGLVVSAQNIVSANAFQTIHYNYLFIGSEEKATEQH